MKVAIVGGGIGGLTAAIALRKHHFDVTIYEKTNTFKPIGAGIGIGSNAMLALQKLKVAENVLHNGMPLHKQYFLNKNFKVMNEIDFSRLKEKYGEETIAIERSELHAALYEALPQDIIYFNKEVRFISNETESVSLHFKDGDIKTYDYVIAADGIHSTIRQQLLPNSKPRYAGYTCWRGITKGIPIKKHISSEAWASFGRFGFAPLKNGDIYWFACINSPAGNPNYKDYTKNDLVKFFSKYNDFVANIIKDTDDAYFLHHDLYDIKPLASYVYGRVSLLGDAAHATTPNMGQGAGQAIEDAEVLDEALSKGLPLDEALTFYEEKRLKKANKVIKVSRQIGEIAQLENPLLTHTRDFITPFIPKSLLFSRLTFLFK